MSESEGSVDEGGAELQLEVSVTLNFVVQEPASSRSRSAPKTTKKTRSRVFFVSLNGLSLETLLTEALQALDIMVHTSKLTKLPFTYYYKGRAAKSAVEVKGESDFDLMIRIIENKQLKAISIVLDNAEIQQAIGSGAALGDDTESGGLASHTGIPNVAVLSPLELQRAKITQKLQETWPCTAEGHTHCYIKDNIHEKLTNFRLSTWANHIYEGMATYSAPPKVEAFSFAFASPNSDTPKKSKSSLTPPAPSLPVENSTTLALIDLVSKLVNPALGASLSAASSEAATQSLPVSAPNTPKSRQDSPSSSELIDFLVFVSTRFDISAELYRSKLEKEKMGPDVLALLPDAKELTDMGIPRGDAYRLKHAADEWLADDTRQHKRQRTDTSQERVHSVSVAAPQAVHQQIGFTNNPPRPNPEHERTDAERAGRPYPGTKGNYMWEERFPDGGARTFWANMPSPTLGPRDPLLAPPGTVFLGVGGGEYIEVLRAPRYDLVTEEVDESIQDIFDKLQSQVE